MNMKRLYVVLLAVIACIAAVEIISSVSKSMPSNDKTFSERMDSLMQSRYGENEPGAAMIITKNDSVVAEGYYGIADMKTMSPITENTTFNIASVSKQFTVVGALILQQRGLFDYDELVGNHNPDYTADFWKQVTFRHLASQSSGIPDSRDRSNRHNMIYATDSMSKSYFPDVEKLKFAPGECYDYVNPTFILIADVIEKITGLKFVDYQQKEIFDCCEMANTYYFNPNETPINQSHGYVIDSNGTWVEKDYGEETFFATRPDGGIYSTAKDMMKWEKGLRDGIVLNDSLLNDAYQPRVSVTDSEWCDYQQRANTYYAMGWFVDKTPNYPVKVYHTGDNGGYQAYVAKYPSCNVCITVLENRNDKDRWSMALEIDRLLKESRLID